MARSASPHHGGTPSGMMVGRCYTRKRSISIQPPHPSEAGRTSSLLRTWDTPYNTPYQSLCEALQAPPESNMKRLSRPSSVLITRSVNPVMSAIRVAGMAPPSSIRIRALSGKSRPATSRALLRRSRGSMMQPCPHVRRNARGFCNGPRFDFLWWSA